MPIPYKIRDFFRNPDLRLWNSFSSHKNKKPSPVPDYVKQDGTYLG
jgi:hypothetical protein